MVLNGKRVNFLGDSITEGIGVDRKEHIYVNIIKKRLHLEEVRNYGLSASRIAAQSGGYPAPFSLSERFQHMDPADVVIIFAGTNDHAHGAAPWGSGAECRKDTFCGALHYLFRGLLTKFPDQEVIVMTPLHREGEDEVNPSTLKCLEEYVMEIKKTAAYYAIPVLDLFQVSGIQPNLAIVKEYCCPDGIHPNAKGHIRIADRLEGFLRAL